MKTRETGSPGFHRARTSHQAVAPARRLDPSIAEAADRQNRKMRMLFRRAFPGTGVAVPDGAPAPVGRARTERCRRADVPHAVALCRARQERAAGAAGAAGTAAGVPEPAALRTAA